MLSSERWPRDSAPLARAPGVGSERADAERGARWRSRLSGRSPGGDARLLREAHRAAQGCSLSRCWSDGKG